MTYLTEIALHRLPSAVQEETARIAELAAGGYKTREIAEHVGTSWRSVNARLYAYQRSVVEVLREDGYSDVEVIRFLGVPTAMVVASGS